MTHLFNNCGFGRNDPPFSGAVDLGALALDRGITNRSNTSLVDLTARVLCRYLEKDESLQISHGWDDLELSEAHVQYAVLDAFASWSIYNVLVSNPTGNAVTPSTAGGTPVWLISHDCNSTVALGYIAPDQPKQFDGVNISKTRVVVNITSVIQGAYLIQGDLLKSQHETPLNALSSTVPFSLLCAIKNLEVLTHNEFSCAKDNRRSAPLPPNPFIPSTETYSETAPQQSLVDEPPCHSDASAWIDEIPYNAEEEESPVESMPDLQGLIHAQNLVPDTTLTYGDEYKRSGVLGDIWHLMDQIKISVHHGLRRPFSRALRDALLLPDTDDKAAVEAVLSHHDISWDYMVKWKPQWVWKRVKRFAPRPGILHA